jgi:hypothetical protein
VFEEQKGNKYFHQFKSLSDSGKTSTETLKVIVQGDGEDESAGQDQDLAGRRGHQRTPDMIDKVEEVR